MTALLFSAAALGQAGCYAALLLLGNLRIHVPETICIFAAAFVLYLVTLQLTSRQNRPEPQAQRPSAEGRRKRRYLLAVLGLAVLYRLILLPAIPSLSDDMYRYIWEGRVVAGGGNPFALAPNSPELEHLRDEAIFPLVSRPGLTTIYPPLAQLIFAAASSLSFTVISMKAAFVLFDLGIIAVLLAILSALGLPLLRASVYALNPLIIVEFSGSGHLDSAGMFFMMLALLISLKRMWRGAAAALALGFLVKLLPGVLLAAVVRKKIFSGILVFGAVCAAAFLPFIDAGSRLYATLGLYAEHWVFNGSLFNILLALIPDNQSARRAAAALFLLTVVALYIRFYRKSGPAQERDLFSHSLMVLGALVLFTPVLHPWYVCWIVPLLAIVKNRAWLLLSGLVFASYWVLEKHGRTGLWQESPLVLLIEYVPFFALLLYDYVRRLREKNRCPQDL